MGGTILFIGNRLIKSLYIDKKRFSYSFQNRNADVLRTGSFIMPLSIMTSIDVHKSGGI